MKKDLMIVGALTLVSVITSWWIANDYMRVVCGMAGAAAAVWTFLSVCKHIRHFSHAEPRARRSDTDKPYEPGDNFSGKA